MTALAAELRKLIVRRIDAANEGEIATVVSALCHHEALMTPAPSAPMAFRIQDRFAPLGSDCVSDASTGLIWSRENVPGGRVGWAKAKDACTALKLGGFTDWRLPTIQELLTLVDYDRHEPAINTDFFACESAWYWTSTPVHSSPGVSAWIVSFHHGHSYWLNQDSGSYVRAVRASQ